MGGKVAARRSLALVKTNVYDPVLREEGLDWSLFGFTMAGKKRLDNVQACIEDVVARQVPGDLIETGVWRGGTVILMRAVVKALNVQDRVVWAADSFEGLLESIDASDGQNVSEIDYLKVSREMVQNRRFDLLDEQVRFLKGWFRDTLPTAPVERIAILRLDGDLYQFTMDALVALCYRVSPGGYVIVDDYLTWKSCERAVIDLFATRGGLPNLTPIDASAVFFQVPST